MPTVRVPVHASGAGRAARRCLGVRPCYPRRRRAPRPDTVHHARAGHIVRCPLSAAASCGHVSDHSLPVFPIGFDEDGRKQNGFASTEASTHHYLQPWINAAELLEAARSLSAHEDWRWVDFAGVTGPCRAWISHQRPRLSPPAQRLRRRHAEAAPATAASPRSRRSSGSTRAYWRKPGDTIRCVRRSPRSSNRQAPCRRRSPPAQGPPSRPRRAPGILAHDDRVTWHDAALEQPEQPRDHIQRREGVEGHEQRQRGELQRGADQQGRQPADAVGDSAGSDTTDDPEPEHGRQHLRPACRALAEVRAVGDDVRLRHRDRNAATKARGHEQRKQNARRRLLRAHPGCSAL